MDILFLPPLLRGVFVSRPNRFTAVVRVGGKDALAHVHDPGRLEELLVPGTPLLLLPKRGGKTDYHVIAAWREGYGWIFVHSGYHRPIVERLLEARSLPEFKGLRGYAPEVPVEGHRVDFALVYDSGIVLMETKGCTLFRENRAYFPDAPTKRGREHVEILIRTPPSILLFLVMTDRVDYILPNAETDPRFAETLREALFAGVHVTALTFSFDGSTLHLQKRIPVLLSEGSVETYAQAKKAESMYNTRFSPEANALVVAASERHVWVLFHGFMCVSCGLTDYFHDYADILDAQLEAFHQIGTTYVARFRVGD